MCYVIAREIDCIGCFALRTQHGCHLVEIKRRIIDAVGCRPCSYCEYEPYRFIDTEEEFTN